MLPLTAEPLQASNRAELLFELTYGARSDTKLSDQYWRYLETTALPDSVAKQFLLGMADLYLLYDQPDKAIFILEKELQRTDLIANDKVSYEIKLARLFARVKKFDKAAAILRPIVKDKLVMEMVNNYQLADAINEIRLQENLPMAKQLATDALACGGEQREPLAFQLGLVNLREKDFAAAEKNFQKDLDNPNIHFAKPNIVRFLIQAQLAQGKFDAAFDTLMDASQNNMLRSQAKEMLVAILSKIGNIDEQRLTPAYRIFSLNGNYIAEVGHATELQEFKKVAETNAGLPPSFAQVVAEWRAGYFPAGRQPQTKNDADIVEDKTSSPSRFMLIQRVPIELGMGELDQAAKDLLQNVQSKAKEEYITYPDPQLTILEDLGRAKDVEKIRQALVENSVGEKHQEFLAALAAFYIKQKDMIKADDCVAEAMRTLALGPLEVGNVDTARPWLSLATTCVDDKYYERALTILNGVQKAQQKWYGPMNRRHVDTLLAKANVELLMRNSTAARDEAGAALKIIRFNDDIEVYTNERVKIALLYGGPIDDQWSDKDRDDAASFAEAKKNNPALSSANPMRYIFFGPRLTKDDYYHKALHSGLLGSSLLADELEENALTAFKINDIAKAQKDLTDALHIREQIEGKSNQKQSVILAQLACLHATSGKRETARATLRKSRNVQTANDSQDSKIQTAAFDACASYLMGDKQNARRKAIEVLEQPGRGFQSVVFSQVSMKILALVGATEDVQKWNSSVDAQANNRYAVPPPQVAHLLESLIKTD